MIKSFIQRSESKKSCRMSILLFPTYLVLSALLSEVIAWLSSFSCFEGLQNILKNEVFNSDIDVYTRYSPYLEIFVILIKVAILRSRDGSEMDSYLNFSMLWRRKYFEDNKTSASIVSITLRILLANWKEEIFLKSDKLDNILALTDLVIGSKIIALPHDCVHCLGQGTVLVMLGHVAGLAGHVQLAALGLCKKIFL